MIILYSIFGYHQESMDYISFNRYRYGGPSLVELIPQLGERQTGPLRFFIPGALKHFKQFLHGSGYHSHLFETSAKDHNYRS